MFADFDVTVDRILAQPFLLRAWVGVQERKQYVVRLRTLPEIAREVGVSTMTVNNWAHLHDIPLRPRGAGSRRESLDKHGAPKEVISRAPGSTSST